MSRTLPHQHGTSKRTARGINMLKLKGVFAEKLALLYLMSRGYRPVARPKRRPLAQTDLLVRRGHHLVLVEVKYRQDALHASFALGPAQLRRLQTEARALASFFPTSTIRIDALLLFKAYPFIKHIPDMR